MSENETDTSRRPAPMIIVGFVVVVALIITGLFLPPISLGQRLGLGGTAEETAAPETAVADTRVIPGQIALSVGTDVTGVNVSSIEQAEFTASSDAEWADAVAALPAERSLAGPVYLVDYEGAAPMGSVAVTIPDDAGTLPTLDLMGWDGAAWRFVPSTVDTGTQEFVTQEGPLPQALALMQTAAPQTTAVGAELLPEQELPVELLPQLTEVSVGALTLAENGELEGEVAAVPTGAYDQVLHVTNTGPVINQTALVALLNDTASQSSQIEALVNQVAAGDYAGLNLDYQGVPAAQRDAFTAFVSDLAAALQAQGHTLAITLATPQRAGADWDSAGQDWAALGQIADVVYVQMPLNPTAYAEGNVASHLLEWATRRVDRTKMTALVSAHAVDKIGESYRELTNVEALANFGELQFVQGSEEVEPGTPIEVALSGEAGALEWDGASLTYKYSYEKEGQTHHVWLGNEAALSQRLSVAQPYNLRGVAARGLGNVSNGDGYADALASFTGTAETPQPTGAAIVWTVRGEDGSVLASSSGDALTFTWEGVEQPGAYEVNVEFALGEAVAALDTATVAVTEPPEPEPVVEEVEEEEAEEAEETAVETDAPAAAADLGDSEAVVNVGANVRVGPGLGYGTIAGGLQAGERITLLGRNSDASWFNIMMPDGETEGWIFASLVTVGQGVDVSALAEVEAPPLTVTSSEGDDGGSSSAPAPAPAPPPISNATFELGGQAFGAPFGMMNYAGMTWIKRQHKWSPGQSGDVVAGTISEAHNAGLKILLSIPGANLYPSSIDFQAYVNFLGQVAALPDPPDAIEVWNEQNIDREWPVGQIDPASYVNNILAPAYNAIKSANSNIMVVSGAPAPTGFFGGCSGGGCDDAPYIAGMAAAGAANYMDCLGIHYNEGIISPNQRSGDPRTDHYTRYFWGMVDAYWNALGGARPLCFTELGYLSPEGYGSLPGGFAWAQNVTVAQQAQWLAEAASLSASSGKVRMLIVWNMDSTTYGDDPQAGYAIIRPGGGCPACETLRQVMGN